MREPHLRSVYLRLISLIFFFGVCSNTYAQKTLVVTDQEDIPLIGVECYSDDYSLAIISDGEGKINIPIEFQNASINLKYLGFETKRIDLSSVKSDYFKTALSLEQKLLEEIILIGRNDIRQRDFLQKIDAIQSKEIAETNPQTAADALARYAEVYVQKSQMGGGSPVIRGFEANKVLLVVDGIRMNNAIYRNGHLQNAITVDNAILDQMEVIYGPSSLMYGSDALGGVIHFRTKDPVLNLSEYDKSQIFGNYYVRYGSANQEKSAHVDLNYGKKKWGSLTSISLSDFGDLRMGSRRTSEYPDFGKRLKYQRFESGEDVIIENDNENIQVGTAYSQLDLLQKFKFQINQKMNLTANIQYSTSSNIPRYDQLILPQGSGFEFAEWNYGPQKRALFSLKYKWTETKPWMDEMILIVSRQNITETRIERGFGSPIRASRDENVGVNALTFDVNKRIQGKRRQTVYYGFDINQNMVSSEAINLNILTGIESQDLFTRYPSGGSRMTLAGVYAQYINESRDSTFVLHGGLRYNLFTTSVKYLTSDPINWPSYFYEGIFANNSAFTWSAGINWQPDESWTLRILASTAFRAPNVDDIGKLRVKSDNITVPNPNLGAERSINAEINISKSINRNFLVAGSFFYTRLSDAIIRTDFALPDGSTVYNDGRRDYNIEGNINANEAQIIGFSANAQWNIDKNLRISTSINYIEGFVLDNESTPLSHIPPLYGKSQLKYKIGNWDLSFLSQYNAMKPIDQYGGSTDNPEYATPEGALAWIVYNVYGNYNYKNYTFQLGVENILDKHYRPFASGLSAPGINGILAIRGRF